MRDMERGRRPFLWATFCCLLALQGATNTTEPPCNVTWDAEEINATMLLVTWSGDLDADVGVTVNVSRVSCTNTTCMSCNETVPFANGSVKVEVDRDALYRVEVDFQCPVNDSGKMIRIPRADPNLTVMSKTNTSVQLSWDPLDPSCNATHLAYIVETDDGERMIWTYDIEYTFFNLTPYTHYTFRVSAEEVKREVWAGEVAVRTGVGVPNAPTALNASFVLNNTVGLTWLEPQISTGPVLLYRIRWETSDSFYDVKNSEVDTVDNSTSYEKDGLTPYVNYIFRVLAITDAGPGKWSEELEVRTKPGIPYAPMALNTSFVLNTTVGLTWVEPGISTGPILRYRIRRETPDEKNSTEVDTRNNSTSYDMDGLIPYANYTFRVLAITDAGPGDWSDVLEVQTKVGVPHAPTALNTSFVLNTTVGLTWVEPGISTGPILRYRIRRETPDEKNSTEVDTRNNSTSYDMDGLIPYTNYTFRVLAITDAGPGEWSDELEVQTKVGVPHAPTALNTSFVLNTTVGLTWVEPGISTGPILRYRIRRETPDEKNSTEVDTRNNSTSYDMDGLTPYSNYTFRVLAITDAGPGEWSDELEVQTKVGVPHAPASLHATFVQNTTVGLAWLEPGISTGPILQYQIQWETHGAKNPTEVDTRNSSTSLRKDGLTPYQNYTFRVLAITDAGPGQWSDELEVQTRVGVPHAPTALTPTSVHNTTVGLSWVEPAPSTGPILEYRIAWKDSRSRQYEERDTGSDDTSKKMGGLTSYANYTFKVLAITKAGPGKWSDELEVQTKVGVPHAPQSLKTYSVVNTSVGLEWGPPPVSTGPILKYRVRWENSTKEGEVDTTNSSCSYRMDGLTPYVNYIFTVLAITEAGSGEWSNELEVQTKVGVPHAPTSLRRTSLTNTTAVLSWDTPRVSTGPLLGYRVHWRNSSGEGELDTGDESTSVKVDHLTPYVNYTFKVLAITEAGPGRWSEQLVVQTDIGVPTVPRKLSLERTSDSILQISWSRPEFVRSPDLQYVVGWRAEGPGPAHYKEVSIRADVAKEKAWHTIAELLPYTHYSVRVAAASGAGRGPPTDPLRARTDVGVPRPAVIRDVSIERSRTARVVWATEGPFPGPADYSLQAWRHPSPCSSTISLVVEKELKGSRSASQWGENSNVTVEGLTPAANYSFVVVLLNTAATDGVKSRSSEVVRMLPEAPGRPQDVVADCRWSSTQARVSWAPPQNPNGRIIRYTVRYGITDESDTRSVGVDAPDACGKHSHVISGMRPERPYSFSVTAAVEGVSEEGEPARSRGVCELPAGIPYLGNTSRLLIGSSAPHHVTLEWTEGTFSDYMGSIVLYAVLVGREGALGESVGGRSANVTPSWSNFTSGTSDFYQATPTGWNPFGSGSDPLDCELWNNRTLVRCTVGSQAPCPDNQTYCNGPLLPDTPYELKIRGFTRGGYNETQVLHARTDPLPRKSAVGAVAAGVFSLLLVGALAIGCFILKKKGLLDPIVGAIWSKFRTPKEAPPTSAAQDQELQRNKTSRSIPTKYFSEHVRRMMSDSHLQFSQEFEELKNASPQLSCSVAESEENRPKNRWMNIFPFDHSRVKLLPLCDEPGSDFINASYIPGPSSPREYIASQGPLPHTLDDFWRLVWEQSVSTLVMLTQCSERGKRKCEQYWPEAGEARHYGDLSVATVSESMLATHVIRVLRLQLGSYDRQVKQMHFTHWPDFGCPDRPDDLIEFVGAVRDHLPRRDPGPILVHCSAGVGRTGTFIAVDRLARQLRGPAHPGDDAVDVYGTVLELRHHRTNMVQTEDQYIYIHLCVQQLIWERDRQQTGGENIYSNVGVEMDTSF